MNLQKFAWIFAGIFLGIGILGFIPIVTLNGMLLGIFMVDTIHNVIHILSGIVAAVVAASSPKHARLYFQVFGIVYALVAIFGLIMGGSVLGLFMANMADHILHVIIAAALLYIGFGMKTDMMTTMPGNSSTMGGGMKV